MLASICCVHEYMASKYGNAHPQDNLNNNWKILIWQHAHKVPNLIPHQYFWLDVIHQLNIQK